MIALSSIAADPLLRQLLISSRVNDVELERVLTVARRALLTATGASSPLAGELLAFLCALAQQCFLNEYVFAETEDEAAEVARLSAAIAERLDSGAEIPPQWPAAIAAYRPLHSFAWADRLTGRAWPQPLQPLLDQQIREPREEAAIRAELPALTAIDDPVSLAVQAQYEENPYPRWVTAPPPEMAISVDDYIRRKFPLAPFRPFGHAGGPDILIAGCGTGLHPIATFRQFAGARVLAVDLSRASLAFAARKTRALGLPIDYAQADILALDGIGRQFDIIEASGSLHHLREPAAGWRALLRALKPGGLMMVGLYSRLARADVNAARALAAERGYQGSADGIRRFRQELMSLPEGAPAKAVVARGDFFSTSNCRDLLFHVQEHQYDLPDIAAFLAAENLQLLGFDLDPRVLSAYADANPSDPAMTDLARWHRFECDHPALFGGMYQFWIQKGP